MTAAPERVALVSMRGIVKDFPGVRANDGIDFELRSPRAAIDRGIGMVHQHFRLIDRESRAIIVAPRAACNRERPQLGRPYA
jgi:ABC-type uncharacterized transport system ATPase subunit